MTAAAHTASMSIRADRIATLYFFHPLAGPRTREARIPILMYHSVSDASDSRHPYYQTVTSPQRFAEQMRFLSENGYTTVPLTQAFRDGTSAKPNDRKPVVVTFDDGLRDFHTNAYPVLARYGFTANMFLPTAYIGDQRLRFDGGECMTWSEVRELHKSGIEFGSHTVSHPKLKDLSPVEVEHELSHSKATIEEKLGAAAPCFSYPYAFPETIPTFVANLRETLVRCGYQLGVSTIIGRALPSDDPLFLRRLPVNSADDVPLFRAKLEGGYDWLHGLQRIKKSLHRMVAS